MSQRSVAVVATLVIVGAGYLTVSPQQMQDSRRLPALGAMRVAQAMLPQMQRINLRQQAAHNDAVPRHFVLFAVLYGLSYSASALALGGMALQWRRGG